MLAFFYMLTFSGGELPAPRFEEVHAKFKVRDMLHGRHLQVLAVNTRELKEADFLEFKVCRLSRPFRKPGLGAGRFKELTIPRM